MIQENLDEIPINLKNSYADIYIQLYAQIVYLQNIVLERSLHHCKEKQIKYFVSIEFISVYGMNITKTKEKQEKNKIDGVPTI